MADTPPALLNLQKSLVTFEDGDVMLLASWVELLESCRAELPSAALPQIEKLQGYLRQALREGCPDNFLAAVTESVAQLAAAEVPEANAPATNLWAEHGATFVADAEVRLSRAQEVLLQTPFHPDSETVGELFRVFHTIKGEAGFLARTDIAKCAHNAEELLDKVRSQTLPWSEGIADRLLSSVDDLRRLLTADPSADKTVSEGGAKHEAPKSAEVLRVPAEKIDALIAQIGELLVALDSPQGNTASSLKKMSRSLQQSALRLRTEPVQGLFGRLHRGARDLSKSMNKPLEVELVGQSLELDRHLILLLDEPLMHLVRNAVDHGIETAEQRRKANKPAMGQLRLEARRRGNRIQISLRDDGQGLNTTRIWAKALEKGLVQGPLPDDNSKVYPLIFQPGFSTAEQLTQISGRGVGMDIVARAIQSGRGKIDIVSNPGKGCEFILSFPLSTAVLDGLVVRQQDRLYVVPVHSVIETLILEVGAARRVSPGRQVVTIRNQPLPVFSLSEALGSGPSPLSGWSVVLEASNGHRFVLVVDEVIAKRDTVIRSLGRLFQNLQGVSAATTVDGGLAMVLDVDQLLTLQRNRECLV